MIGQRYVGQRQKNYEDGNLKKYGFGEAKSCTHVCMKMKIAYILRTMIH